MDPVVPEMAPPLRWNSESSAETQAHAQAQDMTIAEMQAHLIEAIAGEAKTRPLIETHEDRIQQMQDRGMQQVQDLLMQQKDQQLQFQGFMQRLKVKPEQGQT
jgi:hypothetical protein